MNNSQPDCDCGYIFYPPKELSESAYAGHVGLPKTVKTIVSFHSFVADSSQKQFYILTGTEKSDYFACDRDTVDGGRYGGAERRFRLDGESKKP